MKNLLSLIISGMAGGLVVLAGMLYIQQGDRGVDSERAHLTGSAESFESAESFKYNKVPDNFTSAAKIAMPAVVHISASESTARARQRQEDSRSRRDPFSFFFGEDFFGGPRAREGKGSGVIISDDGYIVTNNHVIDYADQFEVTLFDDRKFRASLIGSDPRTDLAVIKIDGADLSYLKFNHHEVNVGEWVLAVGNPFDLTSTVTAGIVSATGRDKIIRRQDAIEDFIQTDAVVNPGNSGGALVDTDGNLVGINTAIATATGYYAGYSFAIPSKIVEEIVDNIIHYGGPRVRLGVAIASLREYEEYSGIDLNVNGGVVVTKVDNDSAAQHAGLLPNDVILSIDNKDVDQVETLVDMIRKHKIGDEVILTISRDNKIKKIPVILKV